MGNRRRSEPMAVKYWSRAGLVLTYWCNASCASCYLCCCPDRHEQMSIEQALRVWRELIDASPHGCRIHISGGEPFGNWELLIELSRRAKSEGLAPLEKIETNAFWGKDEQVVREKVRALDDAGMQKLVVSTDPYHQQFVPIERCRLVARVARELLGGDRVQVRWRDWLVEGFDTAQLNTDQCRELFAKYTTLRRDRFTGRGAEQIVPKSLCGPFEYYADNPCRNNLLRSKHVHVDPTGKVFPGVCAGLVLGSTETHSVAEIWAQLRGDYRDRPILGTLVTEGPVGLAARGADAGFVPGTGYASKCHLCWDTRKYLVRCGLHRDELGPLWMYTEAPANTSDAPPASRVEG